LAVDAAACPTALEIMAVLLNHLGCHIEDELKLSLQSPNDGLVPQSSTADVLHIPVAPKRETLNVNSYILEDNSIFKHLSYFNVTVPDLRTAAVAHDQD
jgi:hypothetical protein